MAENSPTPSATPPPAPSVPLIDPKVGVGLPGVDRLIDDSILAAFTSKDSAPATPAGEEPPVDEPAGGEPGADETPQSGEAASEGSESKDGQEPPTPWQDTEVQVEGKPVKLGEFIQTQTDKRIKGAQREWTKKNQELGKQRKELEGKLADFQARSVQSSTREQQLEVLLRAVATDPKGKELVAQWLPVVEKMAPAAQPGTTPGATHNAATATPATPSSPTVDRELEEIKLMHQIQKLERQTKIPLDAEDRETFLEYWADLQESEPGRVVPAEWAFKMMLADNVLPKLAAKAEAAQREQLQRGRAARTAPTGSSGASAPSPKKPIASMSDAEFHQHLLRTAGLK